MCVGHELPDLNIFDLVRIKEWIHKNQTSILEILK